MSGNFAIKGGRGGRTPNGKCYLKFPFWFFDYLPKHKIGSKGQELWTLSTVQVTIWLSVTVQSTIHAMILFLKFVRNSQLCH